MTNHIYHSYNSRLGTICLVPRPRLSGYKAQDGKPVSVTYLGYGYPDKDYLNILGIKVCDYQSLKPDQVVFQTWDWSLRLQYQEVVR